MFINIHSHFAGQQAHTLTVQSLYNNYAQVTHQGCYSLGIHPWYIHDVNEQLQQLQQQAQHPNVVAIGECGLDKACDTAFSLQRTAFEAQLQLATILNKPLIIHCVRAWQEVLQLLHQHQVTVPVVFHGYNKGLQLAETIIANGYYLSFGKALQHTRMQQVMQALPLTQILLETDDAPISINQVYEWAANACNLHIDSLSLQLQQNAQRILGTPLFLNV